VRQILTALGLQQVNLAGFSFGARVALAVAAHCPSAVSKLSLTAVPLVRPALGRVILDSWVETLADGHLRPCAYNFLTNGFSSPYLQRNAARLPLFVDAIVAGNEARRVHDLIRLSHADDAADPYSVPACAAAVRCPVQVSSYIYPSVYYIPYLIHHTHILIHTTY
jgi:pimeloyl-ACP methyl ester carboxylesterase